MGGTPEFNLRMRVRRTHSAPPAGTKPHQPPPPKTPRRTRASVFGTNDRNAERTHPNSLESPTFHVRRKKRRALKRRGPCLQDESHGHVQGHGDNLGWAINFSISSPMVPRESSEFATIYSSSFLLKYNSKNMTRISLQDNRILFVT